MTATSKAKLRANEKYDSKFDSIRIRVPAGEFDKIKAYAASKGESVNGLVNRLLKQEMESN